MARLLFLLLFTTFLAMGFRYFESATLFEQGLALSSSLLWLIFAFIYPEASKRLCISLLLSTLSLYSYKELLTSAPEYGSLIVISNTWLLLFLMSHSRYQVVRLISQLFAITLTLLATTMLLTALYYGSMDKELVFALLQTNTQEAWEYVGFLADSEATGIIVLCLSLLGLWLFSPRTTHISASLFALLLIAMSAIATTLPASFTGINDSLAHAKQYHFELAKLHEVINKRDSSNYQYSATATSDASLHLLVIGESLSRFHMSSYGYRRNTTPWITESKPIQIEHAYSSHTHTMEVLTLALTQSNQYNQLDYFQSASLIDVLNQAGFQTAWISNQISAGEWDNHTSALAYESDYVRFINTNVGKSDFTRKPDMALVSELESYLSTQDLNQNHFIVLHMMGSHIAYCDRIKGVPNSLSPASNYLYSSKQNDCYDETVAYADKVLEKAFNLVSKTPHFSSMTFFSDHGEEVFEKLGHDARRFKETMAEIPFLVWTASEHAELKSNQDRVFTNDLLFEYVLGLTQVESSLREDAFDLGSADYELDEHSAKTMHATVAIQSLPLYQAQTALADKNLMAHRVNTVGAMDDAKHQGFKQIEVDLIFDEKSGKLMLGHGQKTLSGQSLEEYLAFENGQFEALWFDVKNLDQNNLEDVVEQLETLDSRYQIKPRTLVETSSTSLQIAKLSSLGWKMSYYLPTQLSQQLQQANEAEITDYAKGLFLQLKGQKMRSLSFDISLLSFVEESLKKAVVEPLELEMNTWTSFKASDLDLEAKLVRAGANKDFKHVIVIHNTRFRL
ncbi:hypothetical protein JCM19231_2685 [Vibrio ishigakensis]|uniref:Sulfatase N-terminal domain-containing protein n=1 Tax=Vibrio ishigakensis TaxID=1481914 RepID=A0A0B8NUI1_9VIBR|nr:hypothetical protein JCM19231_2685 [Vibrio ishigakensis]